MAARSAGPDGKHQLVHKPGVLQEKIPKLADPVRCVLNSLNQTDVILVGVICRPFVSVQIMAQETSMSSPSVLQKFPPPEEA